MWKSCLIIDRINASINHRAQEFSLNKSVHNFVIFKINLSTPVWHVSSWYIWICGINHRAKEFSLNKPIDTFVMFQIYLLTLYWHLFPDMSDYMWRRDLNYSNLPLYTWPAHLQDSSRAHIFAASVSATTGPWHCLCSAIYATRDPPIAIKAVNKEKRYLSLKCYY